MAVTYKVLGQSAPAATTNTTLYTAPASTSAIVSTIAICNRGNTDTTYRIAVRPAGATLANQHYFVYDAPLGANDTVTLTNGITLAATDVLAVYAGSANITFQAYGSEVS